MPNLTKDVGFVNSFWPLYDYTYTGEVVVEEEEEEEQKVVHHHEDSDSAESGKSAFEIIEKCKDDWLGENDKQEANKILVVIF